MAATKKRNYVAKNNYNQGGPHKSKKRAAKKGETKHKRNYRDV